MDANTTQKTAASSTPAAAPAGSPPAGAITRETASTAIADQGADPEDITSADIAAALAQLSDEPQTAAQTAEPEAPEGADADSPETAAGTDDAAGSAAQPAGESEQPAASQGDDAPAASGDVETASPEAPAETPAATDAKKVPDSVQQRINELTARAKTAEETLAKARERLAAVEAERSSPADSSSLDTIDDLQALEAKHAELVRYHEWALKNPDGGTVPDGQGGQREFTREEMADIRARTFRALQQDLPRRADYLQKRAQFEQVAAQAYPWIKDIHQGPGSVVQSWVEQNPVLRKLGPNYRLITADALVGQTLRMQGIAVDEKLIARLKAESTKPSAKAPTAAATPATPAPRKLPPPAPSRAGSLPARVSPRAAQERATSRALSKGDGNINALTSSIAAKFG